jgi:hypothetical protein
VAILSTALLRSALGYCQVLLEIDVKRYAANVWLRAA